MISSLALSTPQVRLRFTGKYGSIEAIMAFQENTGSATGTSRFHKKVFQSGRVQIVIGTIISDVFDIRIDILD